MITLLGIYALGASITGVWLAIAFIDALRIGIAAPGDLVLMLVLLAVGMIAWPLVLPELVRG